ncbi:hypothetical protein C8R41DRAFT_832423 [Lentinula lateritia]|uniref:Uncharacterized protein n=1 Tax=Lentinula lateritia TaxID=40482 RepID=A0ABQ8VI22_9AGAR|nr:hypothetical protein C8R41DRAFT_832423 [Lentinula lateritia]
MNSGYRRSAPAVLAAPTLLRSRLAESMKITILLFPIPTTHLLLGILFECLPPRDPLVDLNAVTATCSRSSYRVNGLSHPKRAEGGGRFALLLSSDLPFYLCQCV